jgi:hypothetical protein
MLRRILTLFIALAAIVSPALLIGSQYLGEHLAPASFGAEAGCVQHNSLPCDSLETLFFSSVVLRVTGTALCMLSISLSALLLLRLMRWRRITVTVILLAADCGVAGLWFSQQAFNWYLSLISLSWISPPSGSQILFMGLVTQGDTVAQFYYMAGMIVLALFIVALPISLALLWGATDPHNAPDTDDATQQPFSLWRAFTLGAFGCLLLAPAAVLGMAFQLKHPAPCAIIGTPSCGLLDAIVVAGTIMRGVGVFLAGLAIALGCALLRARLRRVEALGLTIIVFSGGLWLLWFSQRILDMYLLAPWNIATYPPGNFDGRIDVMAYLAQVYKLWSVGSVALAVIVALISLIVIRGESSRSAGMAPPAAAI